MAYSYAIHVANGATTDFTVPFPYLDRSHISASVGGVATAFQWVNDSTVRISPAPANGVQVQISRASNRHARLTNYQDAQVLTEAQLDYDATQLLYIAQEAFDSIQAFGTGGGGDMLRVNNLSDVFNAASARSNIGAVALAGDAMTGPLFLARSPVAPNEAASKAYVDSKVGGAGFVNSFNGRTGVVSLLGADVTGALGYTPVSKAGDVMTGFLTLSAAPVNPMHAATKAYVDAAAGGALDTYDWVFNAPTPGRAAATVSKEQSAPVSRYSGAADLWVRRSGGVPMSAFALRYDANSMLTANSDIALDIVTKSLQLNGGGIVGGRFLSAGPRTNTGMRAIMGLVVNASERAADQGKKAHWTGGYGSAGILIHPDGETNLGDGAVQIFNNSFGIVFTGASGGNLAKTHVPILIDESSIAKDGDGIVIYGGGAVDGSLDPDSALSIRSRFEYGIDFRGSTFSGTDNTAIWMEQGQCVHFSPLSRIYTDPSGNLTFYDSVVGIPKTLASLGGGGGANILPLDNIFTGKNTFAKQVGDMPAYAARFISGTLSAVLPSIIVDSSYSTVVDVRRQTNAATEAGTGNVAGIYLQHVVTGQTPVNTAFNGIRSQVQGDMTSGPGVTINDLVSGYFGLMNKGTGTGGWGVHTDSYHAGAAQTTYGLSAEMYRYYSGGTTVGCHVRSIDEGASTFKNDYAFLASANGAKGFSSLFKGGAFGVAVNADYGLDLLNTNIAGAAIAIPSNTKITMASNGIAGPFQRYNASRARIEFGDESIPGSEKVVFGVVMSGNNRGKIYSNDWWDNNPSGCFINLGGYDPAQPEFMKIRLSNANSYGGSVGGSNNSLKVVVDGYTYRIPLYA
jgi:hypothetical protein